MAGASSLYSVATKVNSYKNWCMWTLTNPNPFDPRKPSLASVMHSLLMRQADLVGVHWPTRPVWSSVWALPLIWFLFLSLLILSLLSHTCSPIIFCQSVSAVQCVCLPHITCKLVAHFNILRQMACYRFTHFSRRTPRRFTSYPQGPLLGCWDRSEQR